MTRETASPLNKKNSKAYKPFNINFEGFILGPDLDWGAGVNGIPYSIHVAVAQGDATIGPIKKLGDKGKLSPSIWLAVNHDITTGTDTTFPCICTVLGIRVGDMD